MLMQAQFQPYADPYINQLDLGASLSCLRFFCALCSTTCRALHCVHSRCSPTSPPYTLTTLFTSPSFLFFSPHVCLSQLRWQRCTSHGLAQSFSTTSTQMKAN
jgi:hypothetical protein